jgi:acetolactate synthase-1/2/3 large subunit
MGIGSIPSLHRLNLGMVGSHGSFTANYALHNADLLLLLGARVGDRAIGKASKIAEKAQIIHIDIDPAEIGKNIEVSIPIVGDVKLVLKELLGIVKSGDVSGWTDKIVQLKNEHSPEYVKRQKDSFVNPRTVMDTLSGLADADRHARSGSEGRMVE